MADVKVKDLPIQATPLLTDYAITDKAAGTATEKTLWSSVKTMLGNLITGFGTTGRLLKYTNGATGAVGNSNISETGTEDTLSGELKIFSGTLGNKILTLITNGGQEDDPTQETTQQEISLVAAIAVTLQTIPLSNGYTYLIEARIKGMNSVLSEGAVYIIQGAYRVSAGVVTIIGAVQKSFEAETNAAWDATFTISGSNILVRVNAVAGALANFNTETTVSRVINGVV